LVPLVCGTSVKKGKSARPASPTEGRRKTMRKIALVLALAAMLVPLGAAVAFAADQIIHCRSSVCIGSGNRDLVYERVGNRKNDDIRLKGGNDKVLANAYTRDRDIVRGGSGFDKINVADGDTRDTAGAGSGRNWCIVDSRAELTGGCTRVDIVR
jgi:hypothetical protein